MQKYTVNQYPLSNILSWVQSDEIAIPEIQRPFVWNTTQVRDLMDSLYNGYPIGYIIAWKNPNVRLKDGSQSLGKKILIDGQQRVTALRAAILGEKIIDEDYREKRIKVAFNPITEKFETLTPALEKDSQWIPDVSVIMAQEGMLFKAARNYLDKNPNDPRDIIEKNIDKLLQIKNRQIGFIDLESNLDIEVVTDIFVRINSQGVILSQADFAMSKIASYDTEGAFGANLRKAIDYFCHLSKAPYFFKFIEENDPEFSKQKYFHSMRWLKNENDNLYDPDYSDVLRVCLIKDFERGKMGDLVSLLSGRNFETRSFEKEIMDESFIRLSEGFVDFINETNFKRFVMIVKSAGFIDPYMIASKNALNFTYALYLKMRKMKVKDSKIEKIVQKWLVMSLLTGRYSGSPESTFQEDISKITELGVERYIEQIEQGQLSDSFWNSALVQELNKSVVNTPYFQVFLASLVKDNIKGFLSRDITVRDLIMHKGDVHHIFPKEYLKTKNFGQSEYNQVANYVFVQSEINIRIGKRSPKEYFEKIKKEFDSDNPTICNIHNNLELNKTLKDHCVPEDVVFMDYKNYELFLEKRRRLVAQRIKTYYENLEGVDQEVEFDTDYLKIIKRGEGKQVEFKSSLFWNPETKNPDKGLELEIAKTLCAFLNTKGGKLFIGVGDDGTIKGIEGDINALNKKNIDGFLLRITSLINAYLGKAYNNLVDPKVISLDGKEICVLNVLQSTNRVFVKNGNQKEFYIRSSASSEKLEVRDFDDYLKNSTY